MSLIYFLLKSLLDPVALLVVFLTATLIVLRNRQQAEIFKKAFGLILVLIYLLATFPLANHLAYRVEAAYLRPLKSPAPLDAVIVLGGGVLNRGFLEKPWPSRETASRLIYGVEVFRLEGAKNLVFCGASQQGMSEAEVMAQTAEALGVSPQIMLLEKRSRNTFEHAREVFRLLQNPELKIGIVTSAYHMHRSVTEFRKYFHHVYAFPSGFLYSDRAFSIAWLIPNVGNLEKLQLAVHEIMGSLWYKIRSLNDENSLSQPAF